VLPAGCLAPRVVAKGGNWLVEFPAIKAETNKDEGTLSASVLIDGETAKAIEVNLNPNAPWIEHEGPILTKNSAFDLAFRAVAQTMAIKDLHAELAYAGARYFHIRIYNYRQERAQRYVARVTLDSVTGRIERIEKGYNSFRLAPPGVVPHEIALATARTAAIRLLPAVEDMTPEVDLVAKEVYVIRFPVVYPVPSIGPDFYAEVFIDARTGVVKGIMSQD